ncbi:MAG: hypothetical protein KGJ90_06295 [Patescibacteria group bacterium]|nr:hypothetical protein [Patescibacteria group bacterium]
MDKINHQSVLYWLYNVCIVPTVYAMSGEVNDASIARIILKRGSIELTKLYSNTSMTLK